MLCRRLVLFTLVRRLARIPQVLLIFTPSKQYTQSLIQSIYEKSKEIDEAIYRIECETLFEEMKLAQINQKLESYICSYNLLNVLIVENIASSLWDIEEIDLFLKFYVTRYTNQSLIILWNTENSNNYDENSFNFILYSRLIYMLKNQTCIIDFTDENYWKELQFFE